MIRSVREVIDAGNQAFIENFFHGDARAVANLYTEDAKVIAPGAAVASGHVAIAAFWQAVMDTRVKSITLSTGDVQSTDDLAYEDGVVKIVGANDEVTEGRYVVIWKNVNGAWKLHRDIWNQAK